MIRNQAGQSIGAQMVSAIDGSAYGGGVTVYVTIDAGIQQIGAVGGGACTPEGHGYYSYRPAQTETDGDLIAFTFIGVNAVPATIQVATITVTQQGNLAGGAPGTTSTTPRQIVTEAFMTLGVFQPGEVLPSGDANFGLSRLRTMLSAWKLHALTSPTSTREIFPLVSGKGGPGNPYSIGPGGDFNTTRPASVDEFIGWNLLLGGTTPAVEIPRAMLTDDAFAALPVKDLPSGLFTEAYYNATYAGGLGTIILWPVPNTTGNSIVLYRNVPVANAPSLDATYDLPDGYFEAMSYNLSIRLARPYGQAITPDVEELARISLANVKRMNTRLTDLATDPALTHTKRGGYNILTGTGG